MAVEVAGYRNEEDYTQTLTYNTYGAIDIKIAIKSSISKTNLKVIIIDQSKVVSHNGKRLANSEAEIGFEAETKVFGSFFSDMFRGIAPITSTAGTVIMAASTGAVSVATLCGLALGAIVKFFQMIEFTALLVLVNIKMDEATEGVLLTVRKLSEFNGLKLPFEE